MIIILSLILGWVGGMIVNYLADVLPQHRRLYYPTCSNCGNQYELLNFFIYPRQCAVCGVKRIRSWLVELALILLFFIIMKYATTNLHIAFQFIVIVYLAVVTVIDIEHRLILNITSMAGAIIGLLFGSYLHDLQSTFLGGLAGYLIMLGLHWMGGIFISRVSRERDLKNTIEALGFGDVTLGGVLGLFMGFPGIFPALILAILSAGVISFIVLAYKLAIRQYSRDLAIPYGPFLVFGAFMLLFFNDQILHLLY